MNNLGCKGRHDWQLTITDNGEMITCPACGEIKKTKLAIIYARFSPRPNAKTSESNDFQIEACEAYCEKKGYEVVGVFEDKAASGENVNRLGLWDAYAAVKKGYVFVIHKMDRLARKLIDAEVFREKVMHKGGTIETADGVYHESTPEGDMIRQMLGIIAEFNRKVTAQRTKSAMLRMQNNGKRVCSIERLPFGWKLDPKDHAMMLKCPKEQKVVKRIVELYKQGINPYAISCKLTKEGAHSRSGKTYPQMVRKVLIRAGVFKDKKEGA